MANKVNKVNQDVVKVTVNAVKPQITFVKRKLHKFLKSEKLAAKSSTPTKPEAVKLTEDQSKKVQGVIKSGLEEMSTKYEHTTKPQITYIKNHFNNHTMKYLKSE
jgi:hypothetical protein